MKRSSGIRLCVTVAVGALSLALITGCSDGGSDKAESNTEKAAQGSEKNTAKALTVAELKKRILTQADVTGYEVGAVSGGVARAAIKAEEKCKPLLYPMSGLAPTVASAETNRMATEEKKPSAAATDLDDMSEAEMDKALTESMSIDVTIVTLSSYDGDGAQKAVKAVSDAVTDCAGGFTAASGSDEQKFSKVVTEKGSGTGDESVAFAANGEMDDTEGKAAVVHVEVVRHGNTVASYYTMNLGKMVSDKAYTIPAAIITAQSAKLK
ncbi:hypothetical protein [Streptomyces sp. N50]|uniref:hypothetical protein n=1 Tax=Streptomyces sp. N50 TaxID=3081765 RepID=UPI0029624A6B|nr:hypothetical protein [Streptomyces sp. N50]WOX12119.1 hypothetical protein R2B38_26255 [Streptomyces sp. N50]